MTSLDTKNEDIPREHERHGEDPRERNITIDEALSLFSTRLKSVLRDERANFKQELEEQVSDIRREIVIRKSDNKSATNFKYSGCKNQFEFNSQRISELQLADDYLRIGRIEDAREILKQAKNKFSERNTHVKIADKYGWDTLEEYLGDDLVDGPAQSCGMIFFASTIQKLSDSISTLHTVTHIQHRGVTPLGFGLYPNRTQDSTIPNLRCVSTVSTRVTSPPSAPSSFNKEQAECQCQRQPSLIRRQTRKASRQDEQLQDDSVSIASEFLQCKADFKEKHFKNVNVKGRLSKHVDFWKMFLMSVIRAQILFFRIHSAIFPISRFKVL